MPLLPNPSLWSIVDPFDVDVIDSDPYDPLPCEECPADAWLVLPVTGEICRATQGRVLYGVPV